jgi:hypothetical protein
MINFETAIDSFSNITIAIILLLYILFSLIIVRQVNLMSDVIIIGVNMYVKLFAYAHLVFAVIISVLIFLALFF